MANPQQERERCDTGWDTLRRRLEDLPVDAYLSVDPPFDLETFCYLLPPSPTRQEQIVANVRHWLDTSPPEGDAIEIDNIKIQLLGRRGFNQIYCGVGLTPFIVEANRLWSRIKEKVVKYGARVEGLKLPFVVCVMPEFETGLGKDDVGEVVFGSQRCRLALNNQGKVNQQFYRDQDGLFSEYAALSAVTIGTWKSSIVVTRAGIGVRVLAG